MAQELGFTVFAPPGEVEEAERAITSLRPLDMEHEYEVLADFYAGREARDRARLILELSPRWQPDLVVCDEVDFGSMVAAERLGLPHATVLVAASGSFVRPDVVLEPLNSLRAVHGLPPDPEMKMLSRYLVVSPFPPSFRDPAAPPAPNLRTIRPTPITRGNGRSAAPWVPPHSGRPVIYFTLGTVFNTESGDLFQRVLSGLRELPIELVVTVGRDVDPEIFGPQPGNVRIERYVPQAALLPHCDLVINHGGSGSVIGALAHGLPLVVIPMGADQSLNAARCEQLGVGMRLDAMQATPASIRRAVADVLADPGFRVGAERMREEIAALPGPETIVPLLERLAGGTL